METKTTHSQYTFPKSKGGGRTKCSDAHSCEGHVNLAYGFSSSNSAMGYSLIFDLVVEKCVKYIRYWKCKI